MRFTFRVTPALAILASVVLGAQEWQPPRTPDGQPDIQGFWDTDQYARDIETGLRDPLAVKIQRQAIGIPAVVAAGGKPVSAIVDPPDGKIPYQPWAQARRQAIAAKSDGRGQPSSVREVTPELLCTIGLPRIVYFAEFQFVQAPRSIVQSWERTREYRVIPLDERPRLPGNIKLHMGDARGRWEGHTLVVETTNMSDWSWFDAIGTFHTDAMTMLERYSIVDANTLGYRVTLTDPKAFTRPWTAAFTFKRTHADVKGYELMEQACTEGERALPVFLGRDPRKERLLTLPGQR